jgi:hypothetical protein
MARGVRGITRTVPWTRLLEVAKAAPLLKRHWDKLTPAERRQLQRLVRKSKGRPNNLNVAERVSVRRLVRKLELGQLGRDLATLAPNPTSRGKPRAPKTS